MFVLFILFSKPILFCIYVKKFSSIPINNFKLSVMPRLANVCQSSHSAAHFFITHFWGCVMMCKYMTVTTINFGFLMQPLDQQCKQLETRTKKYNTIKPDLSPISCLCSFTDYGRQHVRAEYLINTPSHSEARKEARGD